MESEEPRKVVGDYVTLIRGTTYRGALVGKPGPALLGLGSIVPGGGFRTGAFQTYGGDCPPELMLFPGDIYASLKGATKDGKMIGSVARVPAFVPSGRLTQDTVKLVFRKTDPEDASFVYWVLRTPQYRDYCAGHAMGSAVVALSRGDFLNYPIPRPSRDRRLIVSLLDRIDERIELNLRLADTIQEMTRALFQSWFVDFDPIHAKAEGRTTGLPDALAALFPVSFGSDGLPAGWKLKPIADLFEIRAGNTPRTDNGAFWDGHHQWATPKDLSGLNTPVLLQTGRRLTDLGLDQVSSGLLPPGSLLLSTRAPIGYMAFVTRPTAINQGFAGFARANVSPAYAWAWCRSNMDVLTGNAAGSTFPEISKSVLRQIPMLAPPQDVFDAFGAIVDPMVKRIEEAARHTQTLASLRDELLPTLISGELRMSDPSAQISAA